MMERSSVSNRVLDRVQRVQEEIATLCQRAGRDPREVTLMAVTKYVDLETTNAAIAAGVRIIGESREQTLREKLPGLLPGAGELHFIGHLQTNKAKSVAAMADCIESLDSLRLAEALSQAAGEPPQRVMVEVNIGRDQNKSGVDPDALPEFLETLRGYRGLLVEGLMTILPIGLSKVENQRYFSQMKRLSVDIQGKNSDNIIIRHLSMGMSEDYREAILEGATIVRLGSALFLDQ